MKGRPVTIITFVSLRAGSVGPANFVLALGSYLNSRGRLQAIVCPDYDGGDWHGLHEYMRRPVPQWLWMLLRKTLLLIQKRSGRSQRRREEQIFDWMVSRSRALREADLVLFTKPCFARSATSSTRMGKPTFGLASILHPMFNLEQAIKEQRRLEVPWASIYLDRTRALSLAEFYLQVHVLLNSSLAQRTFIEHGVPQHRLSRLRTHALVDSKRFRPSERRADNVFTVLHLSHISPLKGIQYLLRAWEQLALADAELLLVGTADRTAMCLIEGYQSRAAIRWVGPSSQPERWYSSAHLFVSPSVADYNPYTVVEAMASGLPVLVSDHCGIQDMVSDGVDGYIYGYDDVEALKSRIVWCADNRHQLLEMGAAARQKICSQSEAELEHEVVRTMDGVLEKGKQ